MALTDERIKGTTNLVNGVELLSDYSPSPGPSIIPQYPHMETNADLKTFRLCPFRGPINIAFCNAISAQTID
jgi:hypothetical protein